jgi:hypothetical protein
MTDDSANKTETHTASKNLSYSFTVKPLSRKDKLASVGRFLVNYAVILAIVLTVFYVVFYYLQLFPEYLKIPAGDNLLQILITTNGVLLGFVGIVFAQLLSSASDQQNIIYQKVLETQEETLQSKFVEVLNSLERKRIAVALSTVASFISFTMSILVAVSILAKDSALQATDTFSVYGLFYGSLISMVMGITMVLLALALPGKPPLEKLLLSQTIDKKSNESKSIWKRIFR